MYCLNLLGIALELAKEDAVYEDVATKFFEHFVYIGAAINRMGGREGGLWHDEDGYYFDVLKLPDGRCFPIKAHTIAGLIPIFAVAIGDRDSAARLPRLRAALPLVRQVPAGTAARARRHRRTAASSSASASPSSTRTSSRRILAHVLDEDGHAEPARRALGVEAARRESLRARARRSALRARLRAGRIDDAALRRQLELARPGVVPAQLPADRGAAEAPLLSRRRLQGRMPDRVGQRGDAVGSDDRSHAPADQRSSCRDENGRRPVNGDRDEVPDAIRTGATSSCSTSTSTATPARVSAPATRPAGPASSPS